MRPPQTASVQIQSTDEPLADEQNSLKAWIAIHIAKTISSAGLTQTEAAARMGLKQPDLSAVLHGKLGGYSVERLARCLAALDREVRLTVTDTEGVSDAFVVGPAASC